MRISGVRGEPPPPTLKVSLNSIGGFRNEVEFVLTGLDIEAKADAGPPQQLAGRRSGRCRVDVAAHRPAGRRHRGGGQRRCCAAWSGPPMPTAVGRRFSDAAVQLALASYPGFHLTAPPGRAQPYGVFAAGYLPPAEVEQVAVLPDGSSEHDRRRPARSPTPPVEPPTASRC